MAIGFIECGFCSITFGKHHRETTFEITEQALMQYDISSNSIQLKSSYEISKEDFERELKAIRAEHPDCLVWNRSMESLKREWAAHNAFHALGLVRKKTADTDLNWPQNWLTRMGYSIVGSLAWRFIK